MQDGCIYSKNSFCQIMTVEGRVPEDAKTSYISCTGSVREKRTCPEWGLVAFHEDLYKDRIWNLEESLSMMRGDIERLSVRR